MGWRDSRQQPWLFGFGQDLLDALDIGGVNQCSTAYNVGSWASLGVGGARLAYAGVAKVASVLAKSGLQASAFRHVLKTIMRGGVGSGWRPPVLGKYSSDEALRAATGRTNPIINAYGGGVMAGGAVGVSD